MDLSSEEFINFYCSTNHPKASQICPICISPFTPANESLQIQVIPTKKQNSEDEQNEYPTSKIIKDKDCFYQISIQNLMTLVQKISMNRCMWNIPAFFPAKFVAASLSSPFLFIGLSNKTINILDTTTGICCFPSLFVEDEIIYLLSEENYIICFTSNNMLMVWEIKNSKYLKIRSVIHEKYEGPKLGAIQKVILTNELENDSISPIIFAENITVRFSKTRNGWLNVNSSIPSIFNKRFGFKTIYDVEKGFFESFINHEVEGFKNCMKILLQKYLASKRFKRVFKLIIQLLKIIDDGKSVYCGIDPKDLLEYMLNIIKETNPEEVELIVNSKEYKDAFSPKPKPQPQQQQIQPIITQPSNPNVIQPQQQVIEIINKVQTSPQSSINAQPNVVYPGQQYQSETFTFPIPPMQPQAIIQPSSQPAQIQLVNAPNELSNTGNVVSMPVPNIEVNVQPTIIINNDVQANNESDINTQNQKDVFDSTPTTVITNVEPSPKPSEPAQVQTPEQKASVSSPSKAQKVSLKQGTLDSFLPFSPKTKTVQNENQTTPKMAKGKSTPRGKTKASPTKSSPKKKTANNQIQENNVQVEQVEQPVKSEQADIIEKNTENQEQEDSQNSSQISTRRSTRVRKQTSFDNSPEPKKKLAQATKKKAKVKAKAKPIERQEGENTEATVDNQENQQQPMLIPTPAQAPSPTKKVTKTQRKATTRRSPSKAKKAVQTPVINPQQPPQNANPSDPQQLLVQVINSQQPQNQGNAQIPNMQNQINMQNMPNQLNIQNMQNQINMQNMQNQLNMQNIPNQPNMQNQFNIQNHPNSTFVVPQNLSDNNQKFQFPENIVQQQPRKTKKATTKRKSKASPNPAPNTPSPNNLLQVNVQPDSVQNGTTQVTQPLQSEEKPKAKPKTPRKPRAPKKSQDATDADSPATSEKPKSTPRKTKKATLKQQVDGAAVQDGQVVSNPPQVKKQRKSPARQKKETEVNKENDVDPNLQVRNGIFTSDEVEQLTDQIEQDNQ